MGGVCTGPGPCTTTPIGLRKNWVTEVEGLPKYIRAIAHALIRAGHSEQQAIRLAVGTVRRWARGGGKVTLPTRQRAAAALASWDAKKAESHAHSREHHRSVDLATGATERNDARRNRLPGAKPWPYRPKDGAHAERFARWRMTGCRTARASKATPAQLAQKARRLAAKAEAARLDGDQSAYARFAGAAMGIHDAIRHLPDAGGVAQFAGGTMETIDLAGSGPDVAWRRACKAKGLTYPGNGGMSYPIGDRSGKFSRAQAAKAVRMVGLGKGDKSAIKRWLVAKLKANGAADLIPADWKSASMARESGGLDLSVDVTEGMQVFNPQGAELDQCTKAVKAVASLRRRGATRQAAALEKAIMANKTSRARKMADGTRRAHTPTEVRTGLERLGLPA